MWAAVYTHLAAPRHMERVMGIEPTLSAWKAEVLPLNYTRLRSCAQPRRTQISPINRWRASRGSRSEGWWRGKDSNLRRQSRQIYSLLPLAAREPLQKLSRAFCGT
jgi:hypothetical protein